jgi:polyketide cyclase/dehydrase/lipid transport protein
MAEVRAESEGIVHAAPAVVYGYLADMRTHHPKFLPPAFSDFTVVEGGVGAGTVTTFTVTAGGRSRPYRMRLSEPEPGRVLQETDEDSSLVTTFTVDGVAVDASAGEQSRVRIRTTWQGAGGIGGFFERTFAPRAMRSIYDDELRRLDTYAREQGT